MTCQEVNCKANVKWLSVVLAVFTASASR